MRAFVLGVMLSLAMAWASSSQALAQLQSFSFQDCRCSLSLPGQPALNVLRTPVEGGVIVTHQYSTEVGNDEVYMLMYSVYPSNLLRGAPQTLLKGGIAGATKGMTVLWEKEIDLLGFPGRAVRARQEQKGLVFEARFYLVENSTYQMITVSREGRPDSPNRQVFLQSLKILK